MGKPTGFLEYERRGNPVRPPLERIKDWEEFHLPASEEQRREQGARCMNCGVPFCQAGVQFEGKQLGCPLHNLIPEWNDSIMDGNFAHALSRLLKTNNFPEFTGRVCPAFCEQACTCGLYGDSVTVHDNELSIIEYAFAHHLMEPRFSPNSSGKKVFFMTENKLRTMVFSALFAALIFLGVYIIHIPIPNGYLHFGDGLIYALIVYIVSLIIRIVQKPRI